LVHAIRHLHAPEDELQDAHTRVAGLLWEEMAAGTAATISDMPDASAPSETISARIANIRRRPIRLRRLAWAVLAAAAILLIGCVTGWQVSNAATFALPGSPLYGLKLAEEHLALNTSWSDQRRGEVLATIADHRLTELRVEAVQHNNPLVQSLAAQFDGTMRQLISLTATMSEKHENTTVVAAGLAHELSVEYSTLRAAQESGDVVLAQALTVTAQSETTAIQNSHINLPPSAMNPPIPASEPTHTPPVGPGNNNGNGNGNSNGTGTGNGNGNGNGHGNGNGGQGGGNPGNGGTGHKQHTGGPGLPGAQPFRATKLDGDITAP
ncbi:MAG TPA: DUF5667 domain-containing protein, partial [Ktedonobacterales bacterium]|nr:DUF5667 domain-containing protein [Ktedonobacterales bacterium]